MARSIFAVLLVTSLVFTSSVALQVSPNSQCASVCLDQADQDKSDPNQSNTVGSDVVCHDDNYSTPAGQKFKRCVECLQQSSDKSVSESDLQWFLYNIRFAITSCVFGLANASDPISSPCTIAPSCGTLVSALQDGLGAPLNDNRFSYCSAYGATFLGPRYAPCVKCLQLTDEQKYMSNFMVALKAGCDQKPDPGRIISIDGSLFSQTPVNITSETAVVPTTTPVSTGGGKLTTGAYAGIGIAGAAAIAAVAAMCYVGRRKKQAREKRDQIASGLEDHFGNGRGTGPAKGAFGDSSQHPPFQNTGMASSASTNGEKSFLQKMSDSRSHEGHSPGRFQRPLSTYSQHQAILREVGVASPYPSYHHPSRNESPRPAYSPALSLQADTPTHSPKSIASSTTRLHNPSSTNESLNPVRAHPISAAGDRSISPRPMVVGGCVPAAHGLPTRSNSIASGAPRFPPRPARQTRDLSLSRETGDGNISGPLITVSTRFDIDDDANRKAERQRLYEQGFAGKQPNKASSPAEAWPGNY